MNIPIQLKAEHCERPEDLDFIKPLPSLKSPTDEPRQYDFSPLLENIHAIVKELGGISEDMELNGPFLFMRVIGSYGRYEGNFSLCGMDELDLVELKCRIWTNLKLIDDQPPDGSPPNGEL